MVKSEFRKKEEWLAVLNMNKHPEGGYYQEIYKSGCSTTIASSKEGNPKERSLMTSIYFMLERGNYSGFHRIKSDELWHFYDGDPLFVHEINLEGNYIKHLVGKDPSKGQMPFCCIPAGSWFASELISDGEFCLVGCTVAPGFEFEDFELANEALIDQYPKYEGLISRLLPRNKT